MKLSSLINERFRSSNDKASKVNQLVERSSSGKLSSFNGVFQVDPLDQQEQNFLLTILEEHAQEGLNIQADLEDLTLITSEVKAINNQAVMLHGERIKRAQQLLRRYHDGAFSSWLIATYGNRQTPYNFLQYYEFYQNLDKELQDKTDMIPKQVIYSLSSRDIPQEDKVAFVKAYKGETKNELLEKLRASYPIPEKDKRHKPRNIQPIKILKELLKHFETEEFAPSEDEERAIFALIQELNERFIYKTQRPL